MHCLLALRPMQRKEPKEGITTTTISTITIIITTSTISITSKVFSTPMQQMCTPRTPCRHLAPSSMQDTRLKLLPCPRSITPQWPCITTTSKWRTSNLLQQQQQGTICTTSTITSSIMLRCTPGMAEGLGWRTSL